MQHDLKTILLAVPLFKKLDADEVNELIKLVTTKEFAPGEHLLVEGTPSVSLMVLLDGKVSVVKGTGDKASHLCDLDAGECIGELGVLEHARCSANVVAQSPVQAAAISADDLERYFSQNRVAAIKILRQMVSVLAGRLRQTNVSYSSLMQIADSLD